MTAPAGDSWSSFTVIKNFIQTLLGMIHEVKGAQCILIEVASMTTRECTQGFPGVDACILDEGVLVELACLLVLRPGDFLTFLTIHIKANWEKPLKDCGLGELTQYKVILHPAHFDSVTPACSRDLAQY